MPNARGVLILVGAALIGTSALQAGCTGGGVPDAWGGTVRDSAGVAIVENDGTGLWEPGKEWQLKEEVRIGGLAGELPYQFGQVGAIAVDGEGRIFVSDQHAQEIRVFSRNGNFLRTIGRPGSGPGELGLGAIQLLLSPGDTLLVPDVRNRRINRFDPDGRALSSTPLEPERGRPLRYDLTPSGGMTVQLRPTRVRNGPAPDTMDAVVAIEPSGFLGDTLLRIPTGGMLAGPGITYFTPEPSWDVTDSLTVLFGMNSEYRIGFHDRTGKLRRVVSMPSEPRPITERDTRAIFFFLDRAWLDAGVPPSRLAANRAAVFFAEFLPVYKTFHLGYRGSLWVQPVHPPGELSDEEMELYNFTEDFGSVDWDVFDHEGRFLGVVAMPYRFTPRLFLGEEIYGLARDDLDVQYVVRLRVTESGRG